MIPWSVSEWLVDSTVCTAVTWFDSFHMFTVSCYVTLMSPLPPGDVTAAAKTSWSAVVFAQLYTADGACHGLHAFVVPVRDRRTHLALPGCTVGDMGSKLGLNGLDNG